MSAVTVTCPDWSRLAALRTLRTPGDTEPEGWALALEHFDDCSRCRPEALKADPLLVFRRLPVAELNPAEERSEVESVRQAVASMRTASRLESRRRFAGWRRWAAAAVLVFASLTVGRDPAPDSQTIAAAPAAMQSEGSPAIEGLNLPKARVYHWDSEGLQVTWIVDESLEI